MNIKNEIRIIAIIAIIAFIFPVGIYAQENVSVTKVEISPTITPSIVSPTVMSTNVLNFPADVRDLNVNQVGGEILKVNDQVLTINSSDGTKQIVLPSNVIVKRNSMNSKVSDLKPGDSVKIKLTSIGEVLSVEATSKEVFDLMKYSIPILIGVLVLFAVIAWLIQRSKKSHIKTTIS
ncbi:MAG: hypothetical protein U0525_04740 [Patescibacteria group bacterium]